MTPKELAQKVLEGHIPSLAKAITLLESRKKGLRDDALAVLDELTPYSGKSIRLGISGAPGVGKSTLIEALGLALIEKNFKVAVLAIDPSSPLSGGSILGDRIRMEKLANHPSAFIRPSPSQGTLGGTSRHTSEALIACEACGFDFVIIETVGIGQSEVLASSLVDVFLYLHLPGSGDDIQGIKRGILELADIVAITKADGSNLSCANIAKAQLEQSLHLSKPEKTPQVLLTSAMTHMGILELIDHILDLVEYCKKDGSFTKKRTEQRSQWFRQEVLFMLEDLLKNGNGFSPQLSELAHQVQLGAITPVHAARNFIATLMPQKKHRN